MQLPQSSDLCGNRDLLGLYFVQGEVLPATVLAANAVRQGHENPVRTG